MGEQSVLKTIQPANVHLRLTLNGESTQVSFAPYKTLLEVLREDLGLTGTKHGCELGECGACAVLIDGRPVLSCLQLAADLEGREIETVEGLQEGNQLTDLQAGFAVRCGQDIVPFSDQSSTNKAGNLRFIFDE